MSIAEPMVEPPRAAVGPLLPCPFCGGRAVVEAEPSLDECLRIACGNDACRVRPRTEYLLACFADELREAWNGRPAQAEALATTRSSGRPDA